MDEKPKGLKLNNFAQLDYQRLASLAVDRDLSLGGKKPKKIYKPNLNVIRNKDKAKETTKQLQDQKQRRFERKNNHQSKEPQKYIQTTGIFSQGVGVETQSRVTSERFYTGTDTSRTSSKFSKTSELQHDIRSEDEEFARLAIVSSSDEESDSGDESLGPIAYPINSESKDLRKNPFVSEQSRQYNDDNPFICLIQLPDSLPGKGFDEQDQRIDFTLPQMSEGRIGTLKVEESNAISIKIGNMTYTMNQLQHKDLRGDLLYIPDSNNVKADHSILFLTSVQKQFALVPNWDSLLQKKNIK